MTVLRTTSRREALIIPLELSCSTSTLCFSIGLTQQASWRKWRPFVLKLNQLLYNQFAHLCLFHTWFQKFKHAIWGDSPLAVVVLHYSPLYNIIHKLHSMNDWKACVLYCSQGCHHLLWSSHNSIASSSTCTHKKSFYHDYNHAICYTYLWPLFLDEVTHIIWDVSLNHYLIITCDWTTTWKVLSKGLWGFLQVYTCN